MSKKSSTAAVAAGSNAAPLLDELLTRAGNLGIAEGQGANSRPELAMEVAKAAADGYIQPNYPTDKSTDVHRIWEAFGDARTGAKYDGGKDRGDTNSASFKVQVSKLNTIAKCGALALKATPVDGYDTLNRAREILKGGIETKMSAYDALVAVARKQLESGEQALSDVEIKGVVATKEKDEETLTERELRVISANIKALESLVKGNDEFPSCKSPEVDAALENLRSRAAALQFRVTNERAQREFDAHMAAAEIRKSAIIASAAGTTQH